MTKQQPFESYSRVVMAIPCLQSQQVQGHVRNQCLDRLSLLARRIQLFEQALQLIHGIQFRALREQAQECTDIELADKLAHGLYGMSADLICQQPDYAILKICVVRVSQEAPRFLNRDALDYMYHTASSAHVERADRLPFGFLSANAYFSSRAIPCSNHARNWKQMHQYPIGKRRHIRVAKVGTQSDNNSSIFDSDTIGLLGIIVTKTLLVRVCFACMPQHVCTETDALTVKMCDQKKHWPTAGIDHRLTWLLFQCAGGPVGGVDACYTRSVAGIIHIQHCDKALAQYHSC